MVKNAQLLSISSRYDDIYLNNAGFIGSIFAYSNYL